MNNNYGWVRIGILKKISGLVTAILLALCSAAKADALGNAMQTMDAGMHVLDVSEVGS